MKKLSSLSLFGIITLLCVFSATVFAQQKPPEPEKVVKLDIVLSRYDGTRKISSLPYTLLATVGGEQVSVRTGANVAVASNPFNTTENKTENKPVTNFQYMSVGTNIDCRVTNINGGFSVRINLSDTSILERQPSAARTAGAPGVDTPTIRNFNYTNAVLLKDGETKQFVAATDKVSAEVVKIDVTLAVEK